MSNSHSNIEYYSIHLLVRKGGGVGKTIAAKLNIYLKFIEKCSTSCFRLQKGIILRFGHFGALVSARDILVKIQKDQFQKKTIIPI